MMFLSEMIKDGDDLLHSNLLHIMLTSALDNHFPQELYVGLYTS